MSERCELRLCFALVLVNVAIVGVTVLWHPQERGDQPRRDRPAFEISKPALPDWPNHHPHGALG